MPNIRRIRDRSTQGWFMRLLENLRSEVRWPDLFVGAGAVLVISALLLDFRYQTVPDYKVGDIAQQDLRAIQDVTYEDQAATEVKRRAARIGTSALYDLDTNLLLRRQAELSKAFDTVRGLLEKKKIPPKGEIDRSLEQEIVGELQQEGQIFPPDLVRVLLKHRFNRVLEGEIIKVLDTVLRAGVVVNRAQFLNDQRTGVVVRDTSTSIEQPLSEAYIPRDLVAARDYLRQFRQDFSGLSVRERNIVLDFLETLLAPNLVFNEQETRKRRETASAQVAPVEMEIRKGKTIFRTGDEITPAMVSQLTALKNLQRPKSLIKQFFGFFFFVVTFVYALWRYFVHYQSRHRKIRNHILLILVILVTALGVTRLMTTLADVLSGRLGVEVFRDPLSLYYAIPFAFAAVLVTLLVDTNVGFLVSMALSILTGLFYGDIYLGAYVMVGGLAGIYSIRQYKERAAVLKAGLTIGIVNALGLLGIGFLRQAPLTSSTAFFKISIALLSGLLASALASMLLPALESLFKITTDIRLLELSNLNAPILRRLSVQAPGTYHHSLMVGTLAEAAAEATGANPLLVRVAAYYHDLGKMLKPEYFVENQVFGINKHETLSPSMSCLIIASHVKDGLELAKEIGLSQRICDMIPQHHGTRIMTYFYQKAKEASKNQEVIEADFRYPGPKPQTKEAAIMMMSDSVEAASRTLSNPPPAQVQGMINRVVDAIVADNQFDECDITLRDIRLVKESFFKILTGIYHRRIDYPGYDFKNVDSEPERASVESASSRPAKAV
jgi:cyclic-di-AMP phosphodiesterase PgpH